MSTALALPPLAAAPAPRAPGFARAFGRVVVSGYQGAGIQGARTVPLAGASVRAYAPGTTTPWAGALYLDEADTVPATFPVATDGAGAVALWADAPARVELVCDAQGYAPQRVVLDLEAAPDASDPYPQYLTPAEGDAAYAPLSHTTAPDAHPQYVTEDEGAELYAPLAHTTAPDPHPVYLTQDEGDARYATIAGGAFTNPYPQPMVFQSSVAGLTFSQNGKAVLDADHTAAADPHPVYLTQAEADARYALASALTALTTRVSTLEAQVATLQTQLAGHTHTSGTIDAMGGTAVLP